MPNGSYSGIQGIFGAKTVDGWTQLDGSLSGPNVARGQAALDYANSEMNQYVGGVLTTPLPSSPTVDYMTNVIAGVWLYSSRGFGDSTKGSAVNKYTRMLTMVYDDLNNYVNGIKRFPGVVYSASLSPSVAR